MDKIVDHLFVFEGNGYIRDFRGTYTEYREQEASIVRKEKKEKKEAAQAIEAAEA